MADTMRVRASVLKWEARDVVSLELRALDGGPLPPFTAGSHIDLFLANGITRSYSLSNDPAETHRYVVGVAHDANSRGGSRYIHETLRIGAEFEIGRPRNHFSLDETTNDHVFIAGGIGITPILSMMRRLHALGNRPELYYAVRDHARLSFADEIRALSREPVFHIDSEAGGYLDIASIVEAHPGADFYCCGPTPMLDTFEKATAHLPESRVHLERFSAAPVKATGVEASFQVECAKSGKVFEIPPDKSIADVLEAAGVPVTSSCREGVCGSCETRVISGLPVHRDSVLSKSEKVANKTMMICVSRCQSGRLVLDL
ncbi:PDR/VanB family oxidoreductase [Gluconacetobacter sacchari]|uniref:PDR/VanB family oxidoreductase n=1 Tax=Gluconacetobacter sacchari TaxID=92759 RepID=UPI0039B3D6FF